MARGSSQTFALVGWMLLTSVAGGQEEVRLELVLESTEIPDLDAHPVIEGLPGEEKVFTAEMVLSSSEFQSDWGIQGWSLGLWHAGLDILSIDRRETVSAPISEGGFVDRGFIVYRTVYPPRSDGKTGVLQAVILSLVSFSELPLNTSHVIGRNTYRASIGSRGRAAFIRYDESLIAGQAGDPPVALNVTIDGRTYKPVGEAREIIVGSVPDVEDCADGEDNDGDGWTDCRDPDCRDLAGCDFENCTNGKDDDGDRLVDCDDPDCSDRPACNLEDSCRDLADNDGDGLVDCEDPDCADLPPCAPEEICGDGIDNNDDGAVDCEDTYCLVREYCLEPEICDDGRDNDLDLATDCEDSDCAGTAGCPPATEHCRDGIDNDGDGLIDCDDPKCSTSYWCTRREYCSDDADNDDDGLVDCDDPDCDGSTACVDAEDCTDGADNDGDGLVDCDDPSCRRHPSCIEPEICDDGKDNDADGQTDCDDPECRGIPPCPPPEDCQNAVDDDRDGLVDCDDPECAREPECGGAEKGFDLVHSAEGAEQKGAKNVVKLAIEAGASVEVTTWIVPRGEDQDEGVQGWSLSVSHSTDVLAVDPANPPTIEGTDAGDLLDFGFDATSLVEAQTGGGGALEKDGEDAGEVVGFTSAVVLSFTKPVELSPTRAQSVARAHYLLHADEAAPDRTPGQVRFEDRLEGSQQPIANLLTVAGRTVFPSALVPLEVRPFIAGGPEVAPFVRGDANNDGKVDIADVVWCINELVRNGRRTVCPRAADVNGDGLYDLSDPMYLVQWHYLQGPSPPHPFPDCGVDSKPGGPECPDGTVPHCP
jgi:hypothetical protein